MRKREFLKTSSAMLAGTILDPMMSCSPESEGRRNWAGNHVYTAKRLLEPGTVEQVQQGVKELQSLRALGTRHCFNAIADHTDDQMSAALLDGIVGVDPEKMTVTVGGGAKYGQLSPYLFETGFALHNLASLPHISIAGACSTATHGSGVTNGNLSTAVVAMQVVTPEGDLVDVSRERDGDKFNGMVVGLGCLGVITKVTLRVLPAYLVRQDVYENLPFDQLKDHFDAIMASGYSVSLFTDWSSPVVNQVWVKRLAGDELPVDPTLFGATPATRNMHPIASLSAENCTEQLGVPGPWHERLPHFKMGFVPSSGEELQAEYFVPRSQAVDAFLAVNRLANKVRPLLMISEIRTIAADELWMSPCYKQDSVAIHFTLKQEKEGVNQLLPVIERELSPFGVRPHWGKLFSISPEILHARYPRVGDFQALLNEFDPKGKFRNEFIMKNVFGKPAR